MLFITLLIVLAVLNVAHAQEGEENGVQFGYDVSISDDLLVVGANDNSKPNTGNAYILKRYTYAGAWKFNAQVDIDLVDPFPGRPPPYAPDKTCGFTSDCRSFGRAVATSIAIDNSMGTPVAHSFAMVGDMSSSGGSQSNTGATYQYLSPTYGTPSHDAGPNKLVIVDPDVNSFGRMLRAQADQFLVAGSGIKGTIVMYLRDPATAQLSTTRTYAWNSLFGIDKDSGEAIVTPPGLPNFAYGDGPKGSGMDMGVSFQSATTGVFGFSLTSDCSVKVIINGIDINDTGGCDLNNNPPNEVLLFQFSPGGVDAVPRYRLTDPTGVDELQPQNSAGFGTSVAIGYSSYVAVGAPGRYWLGGDEAAAASNAGCVYLYKFNGNGYDLMTDGPALDIAWSPTGRKKDAYYGMAVVMRSAKNDQNFVMAVSEPMSGGYVSGTDGFSTGSVHVYTYNSGNMDRVTFENLPTDGFYVGLTLAMTNSASYLAIGVPAGEEGFVKVCRPDDQLVFSDDQDHCDTIAHSQLGVSHAPTPVPTADPTLQPSQMPNFMPTSSPTSEETPTLLGYNLAYGGLDAFEAVVITLLGGVTLVVGTIMSYKQIVHNRKIAGSQPQGEGTSDGQGMASQEDL